MSNTAKALVVREQNNTISAAVEQLPIADIGGGEVLLRVHYSSINYKDMLAATGAGKIMKDFPTIAGIDAAGEVAESRDSRFKEGDKVVINGCGLGESHDGGLAEYARVPADWLVPLPDGLSLFDAMAIGTAGFTAGLATLRMFDNGLKLDNGPVAVTGATGGVGSLAIDMLSGLGFEVHAITGKTQASDYLQRLGAAEVITRDSIDLPGSPMENARWAGAIDNLGGQLLSWLTRTAKPWTPVASIGLAAAPKFESFVFPFILRGVSLLGVSSTNCPMPLRKETWNRLASDFRPTRSNEAAIKTVRIDELSQVFDAMKKGRAIGRTVVDLT